MKYLFLIFMIAGATLTGSDFSAMEKRCFAGSKKECVQLGSAYLYGRGVARNRDKAFNIFEQACTLKDTRSCFRMGMVYRGKKETEKAIDHFKKGCTLGDKNSCFEVGNLHYDDQKKLKEGLIYYQKSCLLGAGKGCYVAGVMLIKGEGSDPSPIAGKALIKQSCDLGYKQGCLALKQYKD